MPPTEDSVTVICQRRSPKAHRIKDFLARSGTSYHFVNLETDPEADRLMEDWEIENPDFPLVLFPDGTHLGQPTDEEIAEHIGFETEPSFPFYDLVIVGAGPAGLAAAVYGSSEGLRTIALDKDSPGGQAAASPKLENYPGFPEGISGGELGRRMVQQVKGFGTDILATEEAEEIHQGDPYHEVELEDGKRLQCYSVLIATGADYRTLDVPGAERLTGSGIYYGAATAEAASCQGEEVYLLGGGNSAGQTALLLARFARKVSVITNRDTLEESMSKYLAERIKAEENVEVRPHSTVVEVRGDQSLEEICIQDVNTEATDSMATRNLFVWIGATPHTEWLGELLDRDEDGYLITGGDLFSDGRSSPEWKPDRGPFMLESSVPGVFVAGDARAGSVKRVTSAIGEGSMAIQSVHQYLHEQ